MKNVLLLFATFAFFTFGTCEKESTPPQGECRELAVYDEDEFQSAPRDDFDIDTITLQGDCISITYWYGGGCGETQMKLVGALSLALPVPPIVNARFSFRDEDNCEAYIKQTKTFDLTPFRQPEGNEVNLNIEGWDNSILYTY